MSTETVQKTIITVSSELTLSDRLDHFLARIGYKRGDHRVSPGLVCDRKADAGFSGLRDGQLYA